MDEITEFADFELSIPQEYAQAMIATTVAFGASLAAKKGFEVVVKAIRNHKASK